MLESIHPFAISFAVSLLIGIERERSHTEGAQAMGVRTLVLFGLLGTLAARLDNLVVSAILTAFTLGMIVAGYLRSTVPGSKTIDIGLTTELSAAVVYAIGYLVLREPGLGALLGVIVLAVLVSRRWLHAFVREKLLPKELNAAIVLLVFWIVFVPFLPDKTLDPWGLINPRRLAFLTGLIAGMQFAGYVAGRVLGPERGLFLTGFLGGFVSSTMVFAALPAHVTAKPELARAAEVTAVLAVAATLIELLIVLAIASPDLTSSLWLPLVVMISGGLGIAWLRARNTAGADFDFFSTSPLDLKSAGKLAGIIGGILLLVGVVQRLVGTAAAQLVAFIGGLFELQGAALATAVLFGQGRLPLPDAQLGIGLAVAASFVSKLALLWGLGRRSSFSGQVSLTLLGLLALGGLTQTILTFL